MGQIKTIAAVEGFASQAVFYAVMAGGPAATLVLWTSVAFYIVGGVLALLMVGLDVWNKWKRRER